MTLVNPAGLGPFLVQMGGGGTGGKDSRWLTLEVCREFARSKCSRSDEECKYAHPPPHVEVQNGRVTCCFDSIKGKCQRKEPPCKYLHPPQHLKEILLQNGRQNLLLKNFHIQPSASPLTAPLSGPLSTVLPVPGGLYHPLMYDTSGAGAAAAAAGGGVASVKSAVQAAACSYPSLVLPGQYYTMLPQAGVPASASHYILPMGAQGAQGSAPTLAYNPYIMPALNGYSSHPALLPAGVGGVSALEAGLPTSAAVTAGMVLQGAATNGVQAAEQQRLAAAVVAAPSPYIESSSAVTGVVGGGEVTSTVTSGSEVSTGSSWEDPTLAGQTSLVSVDSAAGLTPYGQPVYYKRQVVEVMSGGGMTSRKRANDATDDLYLGVAQVPGMMPVMKRQALIDAKSGIPVYHQAVASSQTAAAYQQAQLAAALQLQQQQQLLSYAIPGAGQVIPRF